MAPTAQAFVAIADSQAGARYVYGAKEPASDPDPKHHGGAYDCSGLVAWDAHRLGLVMPDGSAQQLEFCRRHGLEIPVAKAERIAGALLFLGPGGNEHVVIGRGDGTTIEARGAAYGVGHWSVYRDAWSAAALVPGLDYSVHTLPPPPHAIALVTRLQLAVGYKDPAHGLDGIWGDRTDARLRALRGHHNPTVGLVQRVLRTLVPELVIDNYWGDNTEAAYEAARRKFYRP